MSVENLSERVLIPTQPFDANDVPQFSELVETAKDVFLSELNQYFNYRTADASQKISETPNIQKFALGAGSGERSLQTVVNTIVANADTPDKFPMISITSASFKEKKLGIGSNFVAAVQYPPSVVGTEVGPFNIDHGSEDPWILTIETCPSGDLDETVTSNITFPSSYFADPTAVTALEICQFVNRSQALYYGFSLTSSGCLRLEAGGRGSSKGLSKYIGIVSATGNLLSKFGLTAEDSANHLDSDNPPANRYVVAADMTINIDVVTDSLVTRTELQDLVATFFTFYLEKRRFQIFGRSYFDRDLDPEEWFHILLNNKFSWSAEITKDRQGGEQYDKIYAVRGTVPIFIEDFINRYLTNEPYSFYEQNTRNVSGGVTDPDGDREYSYDIPSGDYETGVNYSKNS